MKIYRDCASLGAPFDAPAAITIYAGDNLVYGSEFVDLDVPFSTITNIPPIVSNPCLIPPSNVCVEEGIYQFEENLPFNPEGYHISYQRCCRNNTINNITTPGDVGATYTIFISGEALQNCNNSPVFSNFPPIVICNNEFIEFDHSATDSEGDSLVYELCTPLVGGGLAGVDNNPGEQTDPNGVRPDPATPPAYGTVNFIGPNFSFDQPLGQGANMSIDPMTGFLDGFPLITGQFVVGICVREYRDGILLTETRRDFQFNVTNCERQIVADIMKDSTVGPRDYVLNSCGNNTITFINQSGLAQFIDEYYWEFDLQNGDIFSSEDEDVTVTFPDIGTYQGFLLVNPDSPSCSDSANIFVNIFPEILADYTFSFDSCEVSPIDFVDMSFSGSGTITDWFWDFDDGQTSTEQSPTHLFSEAGSFNVTLQVTDINDCVDEFTQVIDWFPESEILVDLAEDSGCAPFTVEFINNSFPINGYTTEWDLGDGTSSTDASPIHTYDTPGVYDVFLRIISPIGCVSEQFFPNLVTVLEPPLAAFECAPNDPSNFEPEVSFFDQSINAIAWEWDFGTGDFSNSQNPVYSYPDTGMFVVELTVTHPSGCRDSTTKIVDVEPKFTYFLPNAFTPNFDDLNDTFMGAGDFFGMEAFEMTIFNRWGEQVFISNDPNIGWNGRKNNTGRQLQMGVYVYLVKIVGNRGKNFEYKGFATLVR